MINNKKVFIIALIALILSSVVFADPGSVINYLTDLTCSNCTFDNPTFINYTFPSGNQSNEFDEIKINKLSRNDTATAPYIVLNTSFVSIEGNYYTILDLNDGTYYNIGSQDMGTGDYSQLHGTPTQFEIKINGTTYIFTKNGLNMNNKNITNTGKIEMGVLNYTISTRWNNLSISQTNSAGDSPGIDVMSTSTSGNSRTAFRLSAGSDLDPNNNPNLPFTIYSNTHSTPGLIRMTGWASMEERAGISTVMPNSTNWYLAGTQGNFTIWTAEQTITSQSPTSGTQKVLVSGHGNVTISNLAGPGNAYVCVDSAGTLYKSSVACV